MFIVIIALACIGVRSQTLISRSYDVSPVVSYTVFEPQKDTIYYWHVSNTNKANITDSFYLQFRKRNELINTLKFILSLESQDGGRTYRLDATTGKNTITTGKIERFFIYPEIRGVTIHNEKGRLPSSVYYNYDEIATALNQLDIEAESLRKKKKDSKRNDIRNQKNLDDTYKY